MGKWLLRKSFICLFNIHCHFIESRLSSGRSYSGLAESRGKSCKVEALFASLALGITAGGKRQGTEDNTDFIHTTNLALVQLLSVETETRVSH